MGVPRGPYSGSLGESPYRGGYGSRDGDLGAPKLESMELPDAAAAVAMLHDMPPEVRLKSSWGIHLHHLTTAQFKLP